MNIPIALQEEVRELALAGRKIDAIKRIRNELGLSLTAAVEVYRWIEKGDPHDPAPSLESLAARSRSGLSGDAHRTLDLVMLIFGGVGLILLAVACFLYFHEVNFQKNSEKVTGLVVENIRHRRMFTPVFEYEVAGNRTRGEANYSSSIKGRPAYKVGEKVALFVSPDDPTDVHIDSWFGSWFAMTMVGGMGVIFTAIGFGVWSLTRRRQ